MQPVRNPEIKYTQVVTAAAKELLCIFIARRHMHHALYGISRPSVRPSVCHMSGSVKTVEVRTMQFYQQH